MALLFPEHLAMLLLLFVLLWIEVCDCMDESNGNNRVQRVRGHNSLSWDVLP